MKTGQTEKTFTATANNVTIHIDNNDPLKTGEHPYTVEAFIEAVRSLLTQEALCKKDLRNIINGLRSDAKEPERAKKPFDYQDSSNYGCTSFRETYGM